MTKPPLRWARWWLYLWGVVAIGLLVALFFVPFRWWVIAAALGFGIMEGIGLARHGDPYPPLTYVIRAYVPRWVAFATIYAITGAGGAVWLGVRRPWRVAAVVALLGWLTSHFDVTYDEDLEAAEHLKNRRLLRGLANVARLRRARPGG